MSFTLKQKILDRFTISELAEILNLSIEDFFDRFEEEIVSNIHLLVEVDNGLESQDLSED